VSQLFNEEITFYFRKFMEAYSSWLYEYDHSSIFKYYLNLFDFFHLKPLQKNY